MKLVKLIKKNTYLSAGVYLFLTILFGLSSYFFLEPIFRKECEVQLCIKTLREVSPNYVFLGDSLVANYDLFSFYQGYKLVNSGHGGDRTKDILNQMYERVYRYNASDVIIELGTNDINDNQTPDYIANNIFQIVKQIKDYNPESNIYIQSIYPSRESWGKTDNNQRREETNKLLKEYCKQNNITYIDVYESLREEDSRKIKEEYVVDGLHLNEKGYEVVTKVIKGVLNEKK